MRYVMDFFLCRSESTMPGTAWVAMVAQHGIIQKTATYAVLVQYGGKAF